MSETPVASTRNASRALASVSRVMSDIARPEHRALAREAREVLSTYRESADLVEVGAYVAGSNPRVDRALRCINELNAFLRQDPDERVALEQTLPQLQRVLEGGSAPAIGKEEGRRA